MRHYKNQFEPNMVARIDAVMQRLESIIYPTGPARYYGLELIMCLRAGALGGSLVVATALLELYVRGLVIHYANIAQSGWSHPIDIETELESKKSASFRDLIDHLVVANLFDEKDAKDAKEIYTSIRIPMHHGLPRRYVEDAEDPSLTIFLSMFRCRPPVTIHQFEEVIEREALPVIEKIASLLFNNQVKSAHNN